MPNGWMISAAVLLPNVIFMLFPPRSLPEEPGIKSLMGIVLGIAERVGQIGSFAIPFFYSLSVRGKGVHQAALCLMLILLAIYYIGWIRYFSRRDFQLLFRPLFRIPLPLAISPVLYFIIASFAVNSAYLLAVALVFGAGHLYVSHQLHKRCI